MATVKKANLATVEDETLTEEREPDDDEAEDEEEEPREVCSDLVLVVLFSTDDIAVVVWV